MARSNEVRAEGFEGAVAGLSLPDVIQLNGVNRFSGCITVQYGSNIGLIFFRDGEIVHAEQAGRTGVEAFYDIMEWRTGRFSLQPNVATTSRTIHMSSQHLLLEAHRVIDERRHARALGAGVSQVREAAPPPRPNTAASLLQRLSTVPGSLYTVLMAKDGTCIEDSSFEGETLAGQAAYLSMVGNHLGTIFRAGPIHSAVVHGSKKHVLLLAAKNHYLSVLMDGEAEVGSVESEVRKILTNR